jgi:hypothetical protein
MRKQSHLVLEFNQDAATQEINKMAKVCADVVSGRITPKEANAIIAEQRTAMKGLELLLRMGRRRYVL